MISDLIAMLTGGISISFVNLIRILLSDIDYYHLSDTGRTYFKEKSRQFLRIWKKCYHDKIPSKKIF